MITAIVAAAGLSSRMGAQNKMLLPFAGTTVVAHTAGRLVEAGMKVIVVAGYQSDEVRKALAHLPVPVVVHPGFRMGLGSSLQAGLAVADGEGYMLCLADMVNITKEEYRQLATTFEQALTQDRWTICLPRYGSEKGNPAILSAAYREELLKQPPSDGFKALVQQHRQHIRWVEMSSPHVLEDMDRPEDYERLLREEQG